MALFNEHAMVTDPEVLSQTLELERHVAQFVTFCVSKGATPLEIRAMSDWIGGAVTICFLEQLLGWKK